MEMERLLVYFCESVGVVQPLDTMHEVQDETGEEEEEPAERWYELSIRKSHRATGMRRVWSRRVDADVTMEREREKWRDVEGTRFVVRRVADEEGYSGREVSRVSFE